MGYSHSGVSDLYLMLLFEMSISCDLACPVFHWAWNVISLLSM
jgi:hypothetical protein